MRSIISLVGLAWISHNVDIEQTHLIIRFSINILFVYGFITSIVSDYKDACLRYK